MFVFRALQDEQCVLIFELLRWRLWWRKLQIDFHVNKDCQRTASGHEKVRNYTFTSSWSSSGDFLCVVYCCRVVENGRETVTVEENGVLRSKTVNGKEVALEGGKKRDAIRH